MSKFIGFLKVFPKKYSGSPEIFGFLAKLFHYFPLPLARQQNTPTYTLLKNVLDQPEVRYLGFPGKTRVISRKANEKPIYRCFWVPLSVNNLVVFSFDIFSEMFSVLYLLRSFWLVFALMKNLNLAQKSIIRYIFWFTLRHYY